jgi:uncharacterized membrane protein
MGIFNIFGKKDAGTELMRTLPFKVSTEWVPYKLYAKRPSSSSLRVRIRNATKEVLLTSVVAELPKQLAFEAMGLSKEREMRVGELAPDEEKEVRFDVYSGMSSDPGEYTLNLTAIAHYRDYGHVINAVKKKVTISVV